MGPVVGDVNVRKVIGVEGQGIKGLGLTAQADCVLPRISGQCGDGWTVLDAHRDLGPMSLDLLPKLTVHLNPGPHSVFKPTQP